MTKRVCPDCREAIQAEARVCKHCGRRFSEQEVAQARGGAGLLIGVSLVVVLIVGALGGGSSDPSDNATETTTKAAVSEPAQERLWVKVQYLDRRTCPSASCGVVGRLFAREAVDVLERKEGWVRITQQYDAACQSGTTPYVDKGNSACDRANGVQNGRFAEWVPSIGLSLTRPADPAETATAGERLVAGSDDFAQYRQAFVLAADQLIRDGRCTEGDFEEMGGWMKSSNHRDEPIYFTYCGGMTSTNRLYLNTVTGRIWS